MGKAAPPPLERGSGRKDAIRKPSEERMEEDGRVTGVPEGSASRMWPDDFPTWGPVEHSDPAEIQAPHDHLGDPTRRKHPTILSAEGEAEAPATELPDKDTG